MLIWSRQDLHGFLITPSVTRNYTDFLFMFDYLSYYKKFKIIINFTVIYFINKENLNST
jgi:hypothetical protein